MAHSDETLFQTPLLGGEAKDGQFGFQTGAGIPVEYSPAVFPIIRSDPAGTIDLLGTGFFISNVGLFVTARHVLDAAFDRQTGKQIFPVAIVHFHQEGSYFIRPVLRCALHPKDDLTVGVLAPMVSNTDGSVLTNKMLTLNLREVDAGSNIATFAYPRYESRHTGQGQIFNVMPNFYDGKIVEHLPTGRDRVMLPGPCYRTNMKIHHGASGGPVFSKGGRVFAVNSTGFDGTDDSYVSSIGGILDLSIDDVALMGESPRTVNLRELVKAGFVNLDPPL